MEEAVALLLALYRETDQLVQELPECVRCSACVQMCPTGVLSFGRYDGKGLPVLDCLGASPVRMKEAKT